MEHNDFEGPSPVDRQIAVDGEALDIEYRCENEDSELWFAGVSLPKEVVEGAGGSPRDALDDLYRNLKTTGHDVAQTHWFDEAHASTQYGDLGGTASADGFNGSPLHDLAKTMGVPSDCFPVHVSISPSHKLGEGYEVDLFAVPSKVAGVNADDVLKYQQTNGSLPVKKFHKTLSHAEFLKHFKRFNVVLTRRAFDPSKFEQWTSQDMSE